MIIKKGTTDVTTYFKLVDPATGVPETGLTVTDLDATYVRDGAAASKADLTALDAVDSAHGDNKAKEVDGTNCPGLYRVDWPDAAFATGVSHVQLCVNGAAIDPAYIEVELVNYDAGDGVRLGLTALPNATADAAGGLIISDAGGLDIDNIAADTDAILADTGTDGVKLSNGTGAGQISLSSGTVTTGALSNDAITAASIKADAITEIQTGLATPTNITAASGITLADDAITAAKFDESTAFPVKSADAGDTIIARAGDKMDLVDAPNATAIAAFKTALEAVGSSLAAILADTGTDGVVLADDAITASKYDESTAFPVAELITFTDGNVDANASVSLTEGDITDIANGVAAAIKLTTGWTTGGTYTYAEVIKIIAAAVAGSVIDKVGSAGTIQHLDVEDGATAIIENVPSNTTSPYRDTTVL